MSGSRTITSSRVWLVTGCSSGFGNLFISALIQRGDKVIATARDITSLSGYATSDDVHALQLDITAPKEILKGKIAQAVSIFGHIDVLVNNAGYVLSGMWEESKCVFESPCFWYRSVANRFPILPLFVYSQESIVDQFNTNVLGPLNLTSCVLPYMRSRRSGTIIFMSSIAGWMGVAVGGPYSASKFALEGKSISLDVPLDMALIGSSHRSSGEPSKGGGTVWDRHPHRRVGPISNRHSRC